jgi:2-keto-3-deoxy-L-rhamnonate aldolase RhmA
VEKLSLNWLAAEFCYPHLSIFSQVVEAIEQVIAEAHQAGIPVGVPMDNRSPDVLLQWGSGGCLFVFAGEDHGFLRRTVTQTLMEFRRHLSE